MQIEHIKNECTGCSACKSVCPSGCITMSLDDEGFYFPIIDKNKCVECHKCEKACHCLYPNINNVEKTSYYGSHKQDEKRFASSSGGAFVALADKIICENGVVYGAAYDLKDHKLKHTSTKNVSLSEIQKSKYIESDMENTFAEIQKDIAEKKKVLFCGTPCQVSGLKKAVKDQCHLLFTCDFICHGVPSSVLFEEHLKSII